MPATPGPLSPPTFRQEPESADRISKSAGPQPIQPPVEGRIRVWFNEDLESRNFIVPGIIAIIIIIVGALLTSLVIAREYENGTMETILSLPITAIEFWLERRSPIFSSPWWTCWWPY